MALTSIVERRTFGSAPVTLNVVGDYRVGLDHGPAGGVLLHLLQARLGDGAWGRHRSRCFRVPS